MTEAMSIMASTTLIAVAIMENIHSGKICLIDIEQD
jgi:hypothetical protein